MPHLLDPGRAPAEITRPHRRRPGELTPEQVREIRSRRKAGEKLASIAQAYGKSVTTIWYICTGSIHRHVD